MHITYENIFFRLLEILKKYKNVAKLKSYNFSTFLTFSLITLHVKFFKKDD